MKIKCFVHDAEEGGFWAEVPSLPGCFTEGETLEETVANLREAILCWLGHSIEISRTETPSQQDDSEARTKLIYSLPGRYRLIDTDEYMAEKHREAALEDQ